MVSTRAHSAPVQAPEPKLKWLHIRTSRTNQSTVPLQTVAPSPTRRLALLCFALLFFACWHARPASAFLCAQPCRQALEAPRVLIDVTYFEVVERQTRSCRDRSKAEMFVIETVIPCWAERGGFRIVLPGHPLA